jgi:peptidyl-tRNA hydrolase
MGISLIRGGRFVTAHRFILPVTNTDLLWPENRHNLGFAIANNLAEALAPLNRFFNGIGPNHRETAGQFF